MTSYPKLTHSLANVIIVILYLGCAAVDGGADGAEDVRPHEDLSSNDAQTQFGTISPTDPYPLVGETVVLNCTVKPTYPGSIRVRTMHFKTKDQKPIRNSELHILSNDTVQLTWSNVTVDQSGYIFCYMDNKILTGTNVNIGFLPPELTDEDLDCVIYNGQSMNCTWCPKVNPLLTQWKSSFSVDGGAKYVSFLENSRCSSYWPSRAELLNKNLDAGDEFKMNFVYYLWVDTINAWSNIRNQNPKHIFELDTGKMNRVKPNQVNDLRVTVLNSTSMTIVWERPRDLPSSVEVNYKLGYISEWDNDTVPVDGPGPHVSVVHTLVDLHPYTDYDIRVQCKPQLGGYWSEQVSQLNRTDESAPSAAPEMAEGSYKIINCKVHKMCDVIIMWKKIDKFNENGKISNYTLRIRKGNKKDEVIVVEGDKYQATTDIDPNEKYTATLHGYTTEGASPPSVISITYAVRLEPNDVVAEIDKNKAYVNVWWNKPLSAEISSYTLFYCTQAADENTKPICEKGDLTNVTLDGNSTHGSLPYSEKFMYNLAANTDSASSGMQEWLCLYIYEEKIPDVSFIFPKLQKERSLTIEITTNQACDPNNPIGRILSYNLSIQCTRENSSCPEANSYQIDGNNKRYVFENLEPSKEYNVTVTGIGNKYNNEITNKYRTKESAPDSPPCNVTVDALDCRWVNISWKEPLKEDWNGETLMYHVWYKSDGNSWLHVNTSKTWMLLTDEIHGDTNYIINVTAANNGGSSESAPSLFAQTSVCAPSQVTVISVYQSLNGSQVQIKWEAPENTNGPLKGYQIMALYETTSGLPANQSWNSSADMEPDKFTMVCPEDVEDSIFVNYTVRAVTYDKASGQYYLGPLSSSSPTSDKKQMCKPESFSDNLTLAIVVSVTSAVALIFGIVAFTCRQKWYPEFKSWLGGGVPEEPPVIRDMEKDERSKDTEHDEEYMGSGESARSRIFIEGLPESDKDNSGTSSSYVIGHATSSGEGESGAHEYFKGLPDNVDESAGLVSDEYTNPAICDNYPTNGCENVAFTHTEDKLDEQSDSSGIQSGKGSESDSKSSSCASSGIGQEATAVRLGTQGLFSTLTPADLDASESDDDDGYREVAVPSNDFIKFEDFQGEDTNYSASGAELAVLPRNPTASPNLGKIWNCSPNDQSQGESLDNAGQQVSVCSHCQKRHETNVKCGLTSTELPSENRNRENRVDSSCSNESIPLDLLKACPSDFSMDTNPSVNSKVQNLLHLGLNSNATSC